MATFNVLFLLMFYLDLGSLVYKVSPYQTDRFPIPNSNGLVRNIYWGESLTVVACDFPGLNTLMTVSLKELK